MTGTGTRKTGIILLEDVPPAGEAVRCPKCAGGTMTEILHADGHREFRRRGHIPGIQVVRHEHLCQICDRCGHRGCEAAASDNRGAASSRPAVRGGTLVPGPTLPPPRDHGNRRRQP